MNKTKKSLFFIENSIPNHSKINKKSTQNRPKMDLLRGPGGLLGDARGPLGRLEATLRAKLAPSSVWEASWGRSGRPLGSS